LKKKGPSSILEKKCIRGDHVHVTPLTTRKLERRESHELHLKKTEGRALTWEILRISFPQRYRGGRGNVGKRRGEVGSADGGNLGKGGKTKLHSEAHRL